MLPCLGRRHNSLSGVRVGRQRYFPYGQVRYSPGTLPTTYNFTGQRLDGTGLLYYGARYYAPRIGRFTQADTLVPDPANPQSLNRFSYVLNNPLRLVDHTGHFSEEAIVDYLKRTYGKDWEERLAEWKANAVWWQTLREARPGDILITSEKGQQTFGRIVGQLGEKTEQDILLGLEQIQGIGRAFEEDKTLGEREDIGLWSGREILGLARYAHQRLTIQYWSPVSRNWSDHYLNLPYIYRPEAGQTIHPVGKGLLIGFLAVAIAETYETGGAALEAGPVGVPITIVVWAGGTYLLLNWYNIAMTPTGP